MATDKDFFRHVWAAAGTIVAALAVQTASALFWAGSITARVDAVERDVIRVENRFQSHETAQVATVRKKGLGIGD